MTSHYLVDLKRSPGYTGKFLGNLMDRVMRNLRRQSLAKTFATGGETDRSLWPSERNDY